MNKPLKICLLFLILLLVINLCTFKLFGEFFYFGFCYGSSAFGVWFVLMTILTGKLTARQIDNGDTRIFASFWKGALVLGLKFGLPYAILFLGLRSGASVPGMVSGLLMGLGLAVVVGWKFR